MTTVPLTLAEKVVVLHRSFNDGGLTHAFGGALALAYCTLEPRATRDIDVNVFISPSEVDQLCAGLPDGVVITEKNRRQLARDAQSRLWWDNTPVDIFLSNHSFHDLVKENRRFVPFAEITDLPVLACTDLAVFKAFFGRPKDSIDVAAMVGAKAVDEHQLRRDVAALLGGSDERAEFFALVRSAVPDYEHSLTSDPISPLGQNAWRQDEATMTAIKTAVAATVGLLVAGSFDVLEAVTGGVRISAQELERAIQEYGKNLIDLPDTALENLEIFDVAGEEPKTFDIDVDLWTLEEGRSDLTLQLRLVDAYIGAYSVELIDLRVM